MRRLYALDAVRGVAALIVALSHLSMIRTGNGIPVLPSLAVDVFFVLSGFVMARTYEARMRDGLSTVAFVRLRYRRLFLPLAIGTSLGIFWRLNGTPLTLDAAGAYFAGLAFLPAFWLVNAFPFNVPAWSLFLEIVSNALHGAVFKRLSNRAAAFLLCINALAFAALLSVGLAQWGYGLVPILSCLPRELAFYLAGILVFRRFGDAPFDFTMPPVVVRAAAWAGALSYPLYATHVPMMHLAVAHGLRPFSAFAAAVGLAWLIATVFERSHFQRGRKRADAASLEGGRDARGRVLGRL